MVRKKDGSWQPCGDYHRLNLATTHGRYPLPSILDLSNKLQGCKFFSCIDLVKGYHQIPMAAQDTKIGTAQKLVVQGTYAEPNYANKIKKTGSFPCPFN